MKKLVYRRLIIFLLFFMEKPLQNLQNIRKLKDQAISHNPAVSDKAYEDLRKLYDHAKLRLALIKTDHANMAHILTTKQLDLTKFLGDPSKKIDDFLKFLFFSFKF